jgi:hypothetical protein
MNIEQITKLSEKKWLSELYNFTAAKFNGSQLVSHDEGHHLRVWNYAKKLLLSLEGQGIIVNEADIEKLIAAVFFHDIGMTINEGKLHGLESRRICEQFFTNRHVVNPEWLMEVLDAIENHDDKDYKEVLSQNNNPADFFNILCVSDDLDAYGYVGVYRYAEIYLLRGTGVHDLSKAVIQNLEQRQQNFLSKYSFLKDFSKLHAVRFEIAIAFYRKLHTELVEDKYSPLINSGAIGVMNCFISAILNHALSMDEILTTAEQFSTDDYCVKFFTNMKSEIDEVEMYTDL